MLCAIQSFAIFIYMILWTITWRFGDDQIVEEKLPCHFDLPLGGAAGTGSTTTMRRRDVVELVVNAHTSLTRGLRKSSCPRSAKSGSVFQMDRQCFNNYASLRYVAGMGPLTRY